MIIANLVNIPKVALLAYWEMGSNRGCLAKAFKALHGVADGGLPSKRLSSTRINGMESAPLRISTMRNGCSLDRPPAMSGHSVAALGQRSGLVTPAQEPADTGCLE